MSNPKNPFPVKLFASIIFSKESDPKNITDELTSRVGEIDFISPVIPFDQTDYYNKEMGLELNRIFITFRELFSRGNLPEIKLLTNQVEKEHSHESKRKINIDPGYITLENLILATGKNYTHRIHIGNNIYGDLTLIYERNSYKKLEWTYPDYATPSSIELFNKIRKNYHQQLKETLCLKV